jgi:hypothetical protein
LVRCERVAVAIDDKSRVDGDRSFHPRERHRSVLKVVSRCRDHTNLLAIEQHRVARDSKF